jgi:hypothetical protein
VPALADPQTDPRTMTQTYQSECVPTSGQVANDKDTVPAKAKVTVLLMDSDLDVTPRARELERLLGLSDDVFAFAITLLVLDLVTPVVVGPASNVSLASAMFLELPSFFNYFVSFWVIGVCFGLRITAFSAMSSTPTTRGF